MNNDELQISILDAAELDAPEILETQKLAFHRQGVLYNDPTLPPLVQTLEELRRDFQTHAYLKAVYQGQIVGTVRGQVSGDTCHISRLSVHPDHQNRGIGKKLMRAIEERFSGVRRYELFTGHKSAKNIALYEKLGYREYARKSQSDTVMLICMEKYRGKAKSFSRKAANQSQRRTKTRT